MEQMNNITSVKNHLETHKSTKNLTWKENKQKATLAIYNYINEELEKNKIGGNDSLNIKIMKTTINEKIKYTLEYVLDELQKSFNRGDKELLPTFDNIEEKIRKQLDKKVYNNLTNNSNGFEKLSKNLLKNLKIIVTHKNTDGFWNNSNTKTRWFAGSSNKHNIKTDTHEKIIQAITNTDYKESEKLPIINGLVDYAGQYYTGKTKDCFGILRLRSEFNYAIIKAKWKGISPSGQIKSHDYDEGFLKSNIEFFYKDGNYTFIRKVVNEDNTVSEYKFTTKTFFEKLSIITGTLESLDKLPKDMALQNKQMILEKTCHRMNTIQFLNEFNNDLVSSKLTTNNYISTLKTSRGNYDKGFTASASLAVVYHLIKASESLGDSIIVDNNTINLEKLECYINLFMNLPKKAVTQIIKYAKHMDINQEHISFKGYKLFLNSPLIPNEINSKNLSKILIKDRNTQALIHANENQEFIYKSIINKLITPNNNSIEIPDFDREGAADKSLLNLSENTIGAHRKNKTQKDKKQNTYDRVKEVMEHRVQEVIAGRLFSESVVLPNGNNLVLLNKSLPSAFNKLNNKEKEKLIKELQGKNKGNILEDMFYWPINTYQLKNSDGEILQTMTGSFIDKDSEANNKRLMLLLNSICGDNDADKIFYVSRFLDSKSEESKIKNDQKTLRSVANEINLNFVVRQAHFLEWGWFDRDGSGFNIIEGQENKNDYTNSIGDELINVYNLINEKFPLNPKNQDYNYYANIGLKNISCEFFELMHNKNLTASQLILLNTLEIILKNKLPEFNVVSILGCKSTKDRTMVEIVTECALQATIENAFFNDKDTRKLQKPIDLELLVKNNKINKSILSSELEKIFIDNFDDAVLYTANLHDNKLYTNQNARTHFKVLEDFSYHRKFKEPYKKIKAGS